MKELLTVTEWLKRQFPGFVNFQYPTICLFNGTPIWRRDWDKRLMGDTDVVDFMTVPAGPALPYIIYTLIAIAVSLVVVALLPKIKGPVQQTANQGDSVYLLNGQKNQMKLGAPIESPYGRNRLFPSYASAPFNRYINNEQYLYVLLCLGQGEYEIEAEQVEDTPLENFADIATKFYGSGEKPDLFPVNVVTVAEVSNIEMKAPNQIPTGATTVLESFPGVNGEPDASGDPTYSISNYNTNGKQVNMYGPFIVNPAGTRVDSIEVDISFPDGLCYINPDGSLAASAHRFHFWAQQVDDLGNPVGPWFDLISASVGTISITPVRLTFASGPLPFGASRYQVKGFRHTNFDTSVSAHNTMQWDAMRSFISEPVATDYGDVTIWAVAAKATNLLNNNSSNRFNVIATRKIPIWNPNSGDWYRDSDGSKQRIASRSIPWAFCDMYQAKYGGRLEDKMMQLPLLAELDAHYTAVNEFFDWVFDQAGGLWEQSKLPALCGRAIPMLIGTTVGMVRDRIMTIPSIILNKNNIVAGSFKWQIKLQDITSNDGLQVIYIDPISFLQETIDCLVGDDLGLNMAVQVLAGITDRDHAFHVGMYLRAVAKYVRENIIVSTGMEGAVPIFGDLAVISSDIPRWAIGGLVLGVTGPDLNGFTPVNKTLILSDSVSFDGTGPFYLMIRKNNGLGLGPLVAIPGSNDKEVIVSTLEWDDFIFDDIKQPPLFLFGKATDWGKLGRIMSLKPADDQTVEVTCVNYDERIFAADNLSAPSTTEVDPIAQPTLPIAPTGLAVYDLTSPGHWEYNVALLFDPSAWWYKFQFTLDGITWLEPAYPNQTMQNPTKPGIIILNNLASALVGFRIAGVNPVGQGLWTYWTGSFTTPSSPPATPTGLVTVLNTIPGYHGPSSYYRTGVVDHEAGTDYFVWQYYLGAWINPASPTFANGAPPSFITPTNSTPVQKIRVAAVNAAGQSAWLEQDYY